MLNPFPIQFLSLFAYFLLRLFIGGILFYLGVKHLKNADQFGINKKYIRYFAGIEIVISIFILLGAHTQYAALALMLMSLIMIFSYTKFESDLIPPRLFYVLLFGTSLTLFITGAGALAFDLPI